MRDREKTSQITRDQLLGLLDASRPADRQRVTAQMPPLDIHDRPTQLLPRSYLATADLLIVGASFFVTLIAGSMLILLT